MRAAVCLLLLGACATTPSEGPRGPEVADYVPLMVGSSWTYAVRFPGQTGERSVRITEVDEKGYHLDDAGGAFLVTTAGLRDRRRYLIRTPLEAGRKWTAVVSASAVEHYEIVSVGAGCASKAGRFSDCIVVEAKLRRDPQVTLRNRFTWAKGVGLVKIATAVLHVTRGEIPQTEQNLLRYHLGSDSGPLPVAGPSSAPGVEDKSPKESEGPNTWGR